MDHYSDAHSTLPVTSSVKIVAVFESHDIAEPQLVDAKTLNLTFVSCRNVVVPDATSALPIPEPINTAGTYGGDSTRSLPPTSSIWIKSRRSGSRLNILTSG